MEHNFNKGYILTPLELTILLAGKNINHIIGLQKQDTNIEKKDVCFALNRMYQQQFIQNAKDEAFTIEEPLEDMLLHMQQAKSVILVRNPVKEKGMKIIYIGKESVGVELSETDAEAVKLFWIPNQDMEMYLLEGLEDSRRYRGMLDEENIFCTIFSSASILTKEELDKLSNLAVVFEWFDQRTYKVYSRLGIQQLKDGKKWHYMKEKQIQTEDYEEETWKTAVAQMLKEVLDDIS